MDLLTKFTHWENFLYSFEKIDGPDLLGPMIAEVDNVEYFLTLGQPRALPLDDVRSTRFLRSFINRFIKEAGLKATRGGKYFDPQH